MWARVFTRRSTCSCCSSWGAWPAPSRCRAAAGRRARGRALRAFERCTPAWARVTANCPSNPTRSSPTWSPPGSRAGCEARWTARAGSCPRTTWSLCRERPASVARPAAFDDLGRAEPESPRIPRRAFPVNYRSDI